MPLAVKNDRGVLIRSETSLDDREIKFMVNKTKRDGFTAPRQLLTRRELPPYQYIPEEEDHHRFRESGNRSKFPLNWSPYSLLIYTVKVFILHLSFIYIYRYIMKKLQDKTS